MHFSTATVLAFLSASRLAAAQYGNIERRYAEPMDIYARDAYDEDLYARDVYDSHLYARDPYPSRNYARDAYLERLYRRDLAGIITQSPNPVAAAQKMVKDNFDQVLKNPTAANQNKFNAEAARQVKIANEIKGQLPTATSPKKKEELEKVIAVLNSDDLPPGITEKMMIDAGLGTTTKPPTTGGKKTKHP